jgi:hypothetical protein
MNWESFIDNLTAGEIIPVLGNDLSLVKDENDKPVSLYQYIARELTRRLDIPYTGQTISELALAYPNENIPLTTNSIYNKIDEERFFFEGLEKIAEITDFKFYISTALDDLLIKSLGKVRNLEKNQLQVINYSLQQLSDASTYSLEEEEFPVTVFNLLGNFGNVTESAFNEEEVLEHFLSITSKFNRHPLADYFVRQVRNKILLFLGCDFPDWFMRFVIRILTNERYKDRSFNDYLVPDQCNQSPELHNFLRHFKKNIIMINNSGEGNVRAFVKELNEKWVECIEKKPVQYDGTVFLSYNHRDREKVSFFKKLLRSRGIRNVWFDIDDLPSGEHKSAIEEEIKKCKVFIPMISNNCLEHPDSYTWQVEWKTIELRLMADKFYGKKNFQVIPCILDNTQRGDERIPEFLRDFAVWELEENKEKIADEIVKYLSPL